MLWFFKRKLEILKLIESLRPVDVGIPLLRLGPDKDGGYLVPNDLEGVGHCFSPGVSNTLGFDLDCAQLGMRVFLADASVERPVFSEFEEKFDFIKKFIGEKEDESTITLAKWVYRKVGEDDSELMLQMDIEGAEYQCIHGTPTEVFERFRIMVIEFHDLHKLWKRKYRKKYIEVFRKLLTSHHCVHIHPNNNCKVLIKGDMVIPRTMEFTFLRKDRSKKSTFRTDFPHPLDFDNVAKPALVLPEIWYKHA